MIPQRTGASGLGGINPGLLYRNGLKSGLVNPIFQESARPAGTVFGRYGPAKTNVEEPAGWPHEQQYQTMFEDDVTGAPWASPEPAYTVGGGPYGAEGAAAMSAPASTRISGDHRSKLEKAITSSSRWTLPGYVRDHWAQNPVSTLFFGLAAIWLAWELLLNPAEEGSGVQGAATSVGRAASAPGRAASSAASGTVGQAAKATQEVAGGAVDAVEDVVDSVTGS